MERRSRDLEPDEEDFLEELGTPLAAWRAGCPPPELLLAARAGVLPETAGAEVATHVSACPSCQVLADDLADAEVSRLSTHERDRILTRVLAGEGARHRTRWSWILRPAPAAAVVVVALAAGASVYLWRQARPSGGGERGADRYESILSGVLKLDKPPVRLPADVALTWRSAEGAARQDFLAGLGTALEPYRAADYREAASRLETLSRKYPEVAEVHFYLGVSQLYAERPEEAVAALEQAARLAEGPLSRDAAWYLAIACVRARRLDQGASVLRRLCSGQGDHQDRACAALEALGR